MPALKLEESGLASAEWLIVGPFTDSSKQDPWAICNSFSTDFLVEFGGEANARLKPGQEIGTRVVQSYVAVEGVVDLAEQFPGGRNCAPTPTRPLTLPPSERLPSVSDRMTE